MPTDEQLWPPEEQLWHRLMSGPAEKDEAREEDTEASPKSNDSSVA